ncbi:cell envelope biogenesis protein OmpA [Streptomyces sp. DSM 44917]|uniref:Cell envelope biogenesis protein OmpA n=1 Tax=Streptomyces boetiae TaxID=3075541 RepID=A0ABU2L6X5_9ACTN|nr:cell envelope biogenesis protein OmpA [Streptomyces sp. DSM 44917]MDT0307242.1 cell envelope biogenesis protein OmpA [Streptomyces sp. DSM 44917]
MAHPPIPVRCAARPLAGGLVVPWITLIHNGIPAFGAIDAARRHAAFVHRLCQICGQQLEERIYLLVRPMDVHAGYAPEPAVHPECLGYARQHCPHLNGQATHYRRTPVSSAHPAGRPCEDPNCPCRKTDSSADHAVRAGAPADDWDAWLIAPDSYRLKRAARDEVLGMDLAVPVLRKRTIRRNDRDHAELDQALSLLRQLLDLPGEDGP